MEPVMGFEPMTCCLRNSCSTPELHWLGLVSCTRKMRGRKVSQKKLARQAAFRKVLGAGGAELRPNRRDAETQRARRREEVWICARAFCAPVLSNRYPYLFS